MFTCNQMVKEDSNKMTDFFKKSSKRKSSETEVRSPVKRLKTIDLEDTFCIDSQVTSTCTDFEKYDTKELENNKDEDEMIENFLPLQCSTQLNVQSSTEVESIENVNKSDKTLDPGLAEEIEPFDFEMIEGLSENEQYQAYCEFKHIPCGFCLTPIPLNKVLPFNYKLI